MKERNWTLYNLSATQEKTIALKLLDSGVSSLLIPPPLKRRGRPELPLEEMIKICVWKVYTSCSSRRFISDLRMMKSLGIISTIPHFNVISAYLRQPRMSHYLHMLYKILGTPLASIENSFSIDSSGFSLLQKRWLVEKNKNRRQFKKLHIVNGNLSHVITSATITHGAGGDSVEFPDLVRDTAKRFSIADFCADAAYFSRRNAAIVEVLGGTPFIRPKRNSYRETPGMITWSRMVYLWWHHRKFFEKHYHARSNVESVFSTLKRKFSPYLLSKSSIGQVNELLCMVAAHNLAVLVRAWIELGVELHFKSAN